ncbi:MAG: hypothetical protein AAFQ42_07710 [Pseudomonadota bacterium]
MIDTITAGGKMGGLAALSGAAVSTGIPLTLVVLAMCYTVHRARQSEPR